MPQTRIILIIIDACGVGALPDAGEYGDIGAATVPNIAATVGGLKMPTCESLGLGNIVAIDGAPPSDTPLACFGKMAEKSPGKDSTTGHWEIGGLILDRPFPTFPNGFPSELVREFENRVGLKTIGNIPASGTEIIKQLGKRHLKTREMILYTSADSVFQLAAHENIYPTDRLYEICRAARKLLVEEYAVARVIARPFTGKPGEFTRTDRRKDFSLQPPSDTILDLMLGSGLKTLAIGKVYDLYAERGFTNKVKTSSNTEVMSAVIEATVTDSAHQLIVANCVDFDMLWGHRNDTQGFAKGLEQFDYSLSELTASLRKDDILIITADHGCDPTIKSTTDHSREYVPLLVYGSALRSGVNLGTRQTFSDIACTIADYFELKHAFPGTSFLPQVRK